MKAILALIIWLLLVTFFSLVPIKSTGAELIPHIDKWIHVFFYTILSYLLSGVLKSNYRAVTNVFLISIVVSSLYGFMIECLQGVLNTGRHFEYFDIIANIIGSLTGSLLYNFLRKK